jgi:biopolymer transport protein ExbD
MKRILPLVAAAVITGILACGALSVGIAAAANRSGVQPSDTPAVSVRAGDSYSGDSHLAQLQALVRQYQDREQQYQSQLSQAQATLEEYQQVLAALQRAGVIRIAADGRILLRTPQAGGG